jgi:phospho-N-acetylmuramoyl-pentapeptide-transferase
VAILAVFNGLLALLVSCAISIVLGFIYVKVMRKLELGQPIDADIPENHLEKVGTPTGGGLFFLISITVTTLIFNKMGSPQIKILMASMWGFAFVGLVDDLMKVFKPASFGLKSSRKLAMQVLVAALLFWLISTASLQTTVVSHPWFPSLSWDIGFWYPIAFLFYLVLFVNSVNITDGLDTLATQVAISPLLLLAVIGGIFGLGFHSSEVQMLASSGGGDVMFLLLTTIGALLGFLWYNAPKAQVFMGDTGSHAIGALIAVSALLLKVELIALIGSLVFLVECCSSFLQIVSLRLFNKKIFKIAPLHHHYEKKGVAEGKIVVRLQVVSILASVGAAIMFILRYL